ncbi:MAG: aminotransferase class V-fold PLP-dependent enzyme [Clostridia bacterium]|nr:aminotransferase class V-fold PLP-dependent enzyme [Clostridia bacterium]
MLYFESDYTEGAHPAVLAHLVKTNMEHLSGYGNDRYTESAKEKIRHAIGCPDADVFFLVGGTQTNKTVIASLLRPFEGAITAESGHIAQHEAGAIENSGHKVLPLPAKDGRLDADTLSMYLQRFFTDENHEHMVIPGMVYISHPTEYGTLYSKDGLAALHAVCKAWNLPLYIDGARLGYGIASPSSDMTLSDIAANCDAFYIGGTKVGALCGEAVVFPQKNTSPKGFFTTIKQNGALLAKGRLTGVQFDALFTEDENGEPLYLSISRHAIVCAEKLRAVFREKGYRFHAETPTNQIFVILENGQMERLAKQVTFSYWEPYDDTHTVVRFATSWATDPADIDELRDIL